VFVVVGLDTTAATNIAFTSEDGVLWTQRVMPSTKLWSALTYGNNQWFVKANAADTDAVALLNVGARAKFRAEIDVGSLVTLEYSILEWI